MPDPRPDAPSAPSPDAPAARELLLSMSGLDFMRAMHDGRLPGAPIAALLAYRLHQVEPGRVVFRGTPGPAHANPMGGLHGGWYGTLLDSAMGCAVMTAVPQGRWYTTLEYKVNIIRPIPPGTEIEAEGTLQHAGRSTGVATGTIRGVADGRLHATGSTTCAILPG